MEHNPTELLATGELALFLIGAILSILLLGVLLLPSMMKFRVPFWVRIKGELETDESLLFLVEKRVEARGFMTLRVSAKELSLTRDKATYYTIRLIEGGQGLSMFRVGDEVTHSSPLSVLSGAGIAWLVIICHETLKKSRLQPEWGWDHTFTETRSKPFGALLGQAILLNPWR